MEIWVICVQNGDPLTVADNNAQIAMAHHSLDSLPAELVQRALAKMKAEQLMRVCQGNAELTRLATAPHIWATKIVHVRTGHEVRLILSIHELLRRVQHIDFSHSSCSIADIVALIRGAERLVSVRLGNMESQVTDDLVTLLTKRHGDSLRGLYLDRSYQLTNAALEAIGQYCPRLESLSLYACMFSSLSIQRLQEAPCATNLKHLNLGRCHLVDFATVRTEVQSFTQLKSLVLAGNDSVLPLHLVELVKRSKKLRKLDITDCIEVCRKDVQALERLRPNGRLTIVHSSKLDDFSPASIRAYLLSLEGLVAN